MDKKHLTPADMKQREKYIKGMKKSNGGEFEKRYPGKGKEVMYATANKMAMKESYKDYFKQRLFENIMATNTELSADNTMTQSVVPNNMYTNSDMYAQVTPATPSPSYPTYTVPPPTRDQFPSDQSWQNAWDAWRQDYLRYLRGWSPNPQNGPPSPYPPPPNPAHYPNGERDGRYRQDYREWHRRQPRA